MSQPTPACGSSDLRYSNSPCREIPPSTECPGNLTGVGLRPDGRRNERAGVPEFRIGSSFGTLRRMSSKIATMRTGAPILSMVSTVPPAPLPAASENEGCGVGGCRRAVMPTAMTAPSNRSFYPIVASRKSMIARQKSGRSSGLRLLMKWRSVTTGASSQTAPAFSRSSLIPGEPVTRTPR